MISPLTAFDRNDNGEKNSTTSSINYLKNSLSFRPKWKTLWSFKQEDNYEMTRNNSYPIIPNNSAPYFSSFTLPIPSIDNNSLSVLGAAAAKSFKVLS